MPSRDWRDVGSTRRYTPNRVGDQEFADLLMRQEAERQERIARARRYHRLSKRLGNPKK